MWCRGWNKGKDNKRIKLLGWMIHKQIKIYDEKENPFTTSQ